MVVAQSAAIDHEGWMPALRRSAQLTEGRYGHVFVFAIYLTVITTVPLSLVGFGFADDSTTVASFLVGLIVQVFALSFGALATALLYFDLRTRSEVTAEQARTAGPDLTGGDSPQTDHALDPRSYTDQTRPKGWYIDPRSPSRMVYWGAKDPPDWGATTRTPRKVRRAWQESQDRCEVAPEEWVQ
jgi:hypothetical protein